MKKGVRYFATKAIDSNSAAVPGITGGWDYQGNLSGTELDFSSVDVIETSGAGWYLHGVDLSVIGDGYLEITHDTYTVLPDAYHINDIQNHDEDDVWTSFLDSYTAGSTPLSLANTIFQVFANDDFIEPMTITSAALGAQYGGNGEDLTGWSLSVASSTVPVSGTVTITDEVTRLIEIDIPKEQLPSSLIVAPATTFNINCQIQGTSPTGKKKTVGKFVIQLNKDYNTN